jgi:hypothetical protein
MDKSEQIVAWVTALVYPTAGYQLRWDRSCVILYVFSVFSAD